MRKSLGATRRERVLAENPWRQVVLLQDPEKGSRVVRRINASSDGPDLVDRASALGLIRQVRIPGFALIEDRAIVGSTLEIAESYVEGFTIASAAEAVRSIISVSVAISLVYDLARGLTVLHSIREPTGRPAKLIHGRLDLDQLLLSPTGEIRAIGLEGLRGEAAGDVAALLKVLHNLLVSKANSRAGSGLLSRLSQLRFESADQMANALAAYLDRQNDGEVAQKRIAFTSQVAEKIQWAPSYAERGGSIVPDTPTDSSRAGGGPPPVPLDEATPIPLRQRVRGALGASGRVEMDEDGDGPTVTDRMPPEELDASEATVDSAPAYSASTNVDRAARDGLLGPAAAQDVVPPGKDRQTVTVGNYRVVASIGRGGMGEIYLARPVAGAAYRGLVALKVLGLDDSADDEALGMFIDEAAIMAHIDHPNVLKVVDFGRAKGRHFLAMEYLEGRPLVRVMIDAYQRENGLDYAVIAAIGADAARGLFAAHTATNQQGQPLRVVHRDVSPQNIFITYPGITKVIDFGVARATQRVSKTAVGVVKGKAAYMSPEQTEGREVDARSDVFSLGICLWEMTAGRRLFKRDSEYETLMAVSTAPVERPTAVRGKPNPILDKVIMGALTRNRDKRTQSAFDLATQLTEFQQGTGLKDGRTAITELMQRLFGNVAAEERALIRTLEARAATEEEVDSLRRLSGVSPRKGAKPEVTIVGAPSGLQELDNFGSEHSRSDVRVEALPPSGPTGLAEGLIAPEPPPAAAAARTEKKPVSTGDKVLRAVEAIIAEQVAAHAHAAEGETRPLATRSAAPEHQAEGDPTSVLPKEPAFVVRDPSDREAQTPFEQETEEKVLQMGRARRPSSSSRTEPGSGIMSDSTEEFSPEGTTTAKRPLSGTRARSTRRLLLAFGVLALVAAFGSSFGISEWLSESMAKVGLGAKERGAEGRPGDGMPAPPDRSSKPGNMARIAPVVIEAPEQASISDDELDRSESEPEANGSRAGSRSTSTSSASIVQLTDDAKKHGFIITSSEGTLLLDDGKGSTVVIDPGARVMKLHAGRARGWIVETSARGLTQVVWIGSLDGGRYFARPLSVNDCAARVEVTHSGIRLRYARHVIDLPHGGGSLHDVSLSRPAFAQRMEIEPLGLAFGQRGDRPENEAVRCGIGWWGGHVVLRSLPEGRYTLRWIGLGKTETTSLEVGPKAAIGGRLVRTSSSSR
jgi:serine/threonine protein kinase